MENNNIERLFNKLEIYEYEKIIKKIDDYYIIYKDNPGVTFSLDPKIEKCLMDGEEGFQYYFSSYMDSGYLTSRMKHLIEESKMIKMSNNPDYELTKYIDSVADKFENISPDINTFYKIKMLRDEYYKDPYKFTFFDQTLVFFAGLKYLPEFKKVMDSISEELANRLKTGENIVLATVEIFENRNIRLDLEPFFERFDIDKLKDELKEELNDALQAESFITVSNKLKQLVRGMISKGVDEEEVLKEVLPEAYGLVKAVIEHVTGKKAYDVQLMGAIAMNNGNVSQMYTGEGKTLTAIFPAYLNALLGKEVDIFTPNDYLAKRDATDNKRIFELLNMSANYLSENQTVEEKKKVYKSDIIYGASSQFAFDFLKDTTEKDPTKIMQRSEKPGFVIVDEADQILIDDAQTPYILNDSSKGLSLDDRNANDTAIKKMYLALEIEKLLSSNVKRVDNIYDFEALTEENSDEQQKKYSKDANIIVFSGNSSMDNKAVLTKKGEYELFRYLLSDKIKIYEMHNKDYFVDNPLYIDGEDYTMNNNSLSLTISGIEKAIKNTKEFFDLYMDWLTKSEYQNMRSYVNNAIKARYILEKGKDYQIVTNPETNKEEVKVLKSGRIAKDSKYRDGLHQAIELKEGLGVILGENEKIFDNSTSSISNRALLSRYSKVSGMTGTADKDIFDKIYGLDTFDVPKNKEYEYSKNPHLNSMPFQRVDNPTILCKTNKLKTVLILKDVIDSYKKKQPVLVVTDSDEEAKYIYSLLTTGLNPPYDNLKVGLLTSSNNNEEEAEIIRDAGKLGSITIATQRAGRGTDIKLGGESVVNFNTVKEQILLVEAANFVLTNAIDASSGEITEDKKHKLAKLASDTVTNHPEYLKNTLENIRKMYLNDPTYKDKIDYLTNERINKLKNEVYLTGGLKYIQTKPFATTRNDDQGKGRVGRQGEPGETIMYASLSDIESFGIDKESEDYKTVVDILGEKNYVSDENVDGAISQVIENAQSNNEFNINYSIAMSDSTDLAISSIGLMLLRKRKQILNNDINNIEVLMNNTIFRTIELLIKDNVPEKRIKKVNKNKTKLSKLKLNISSLEEDLQNIFSSTIDINDVISNCSTVADLKLAIYDNVSKIREQLNIGIPKEKSELKDRETVINSINKTYNSFVEKSDVINLQIMNDRIAGNQDHNRVIDFQNIYNDCIKSSLYECVKSSFKPGLEKTINNEEVDSDVVDLINELKECNNYEDLDSFNAKTR